MPQVQDGRDRTLIQEYQLNGGANQQWDLVPLNDGNVEVVNAYSGKLRTPRRSLACAVDDETDGNGKEKSCRQPAPTRSGFRVRWGRDRRLKDRCRRSILASRPSRSSRPRRGWLGRLARPGGEAAEAVDGARPKGSTRPTIRIWVYMKQVTFPSLLFCLTSRRWFGPQRTTGVGPDPKKGLVLLPLAD